MTAGGAEEDTTSTDRRKKREGERAESKVPRREKKGRGKGPNETANGNAYQEKGKAVDAPVGQVMPH